MEANTKTTRFLIYHNDFGTDTFDITNDTRSDVEILWDRVTTNHDHWESIDAYAVTVKDNEVIDAEAIYLNEDSDIDPGYIREYEERRHD